MQVGTSESGRYPVLSREREVVDADHVDGVVDVIHRAARGTLRTRSGAYVVRQVRDRAGEGCVLEVDDRDLDLSSLEISALDFCFGDAIVSVHADALTVSGGTVRVARPDRVYSTGRRGVDLLPGKAQLRVGSSAELPIVEFALDEVVVGEFTKTDLDLCWHAATVVIVESSSTITIPCEVLFRGFGNPGEARFEVRVDAENCRGLVRAYSHVRFPRLFDRGALASEQVIGLFRASHYLDLRETDSQPTEAWCCPDFAGDVSVDSVYRSTDGDLLGHVSVTRAYSRTWLGHQLSTLKGHRESADCRLALYQHFASVPTMMDGREGVFLLGYYDRSLRWHQLFFEGFVDWIRDERLVSVTPFDRFEPAEADAPANCIEAGDYVITDAAPADIPLAVALIREQMPELALAAFDIDEQRLVSDSLHPDYARLEVERGRRALVVHERGELVGVALCETGSRHLSLFNLFNLAQVYNREGISEAAHAGLFRAVREFYAARGVHDPVIVAPPRRFRSPGHAGLRLDETMGCIIWSGETLEHYQTYVRYCFEKIGATSLTKAS